MNEIICHKIPYDSKTEAKKTSKQVKVSINTVTKENPDFIFVSNVINGM